jgi:hypothetical protein
MKNEKQGYYFKEKMLRSSNLASIFSNSKYIKRYMDLNFEDHELSCFDLTSKQLHLVAYIGRTSANQKSQRIVKNRERIEEMKFQKFNLRVASIQLDLDLDLLDSSSSCL